MPERRAGQSLYEVIRTKKATFVDTLPDPGSDWPADVRVVYLDLRARLFEEGLTAEGLCKSCGIRDNNIHSRFREILGKGIKEYIIDCRIMMSIELLQHDIDVYKIAYCIGYTTLGGFSTTFKRRIGYSPQQVRRHIRGSLDGQEGNS